VSSWADFEFYINAIFFAIYHVFDQCSKYMHLSLGYDFAWENSPN